MSEHLFESCIKLIVAIESYKSLFENLVFLIEGIYLEIGIVTHCLGEPVPIFYGASLECNSGWGEYNLIAISIISDDDFLFAIMELAHMGVNPIIDSEEDIAPETGLDTVFRVFADAYFKKVATVENIYLHFNLVIEPSTTDAGSHIVSFKFGNRSDAPDSGFCHVEYLMDFLDGVC